MTQQATEEAQPRMLTIAEACDQLGIGLSKAYELIRKGDLKAKDLNNVKGQYAMPGRPGKRRALRVPQAEIDRFLAERDA
jgi:predicted DNA-binding transcriptional regulator AlpA